MPGSLAAGDSPAARLLRALRAGRPMLLDVATAERAACSWVRCAEHLDLEGIAGSRFPSVRHIDTEIRRTETAVA